MNVCATIKQELVAYLDGELEAARTTEIREHVAACAGCRREADEFAAVWNTLDAVTVTPAAAGAAARVATAVLAAEGAQAARPAMPARSGTVKLVAPLELDLPRRQQCPNAAACDLSAADGVCQQERKVS